MRAVAACCGVALWAACSNGTAVCTGIPCSDGGLDGGDAGANPFGAYCKVDGGAGAPCPGGLSCITEPGAGGGQCSQACGAGLPACPALGVCPSGGNAPCLLSCQTVANCPPEEVCGPSAFGNVCLPDCRIHSDTCGTGAACDTTLGFCVQIGPQAFGQTCDGQDAGHCQASLLCVRLSASAVRGVCTQACSLAVACPPFPAGAVCDIQSTFGSLCGWPCGGIVGGCPPGLVCADAGTTLLCQ